MLVELDTEMKRKITSMVKNCCLEMHAFHTNNDLDIIPLTSYDVLIGMDWMDKHFKFLDFHNKIIAFLDEDKNTVHINDIPRPISIR